MSILRIVIFCHNFIVLLQTKVCFQGLTLEHQVHRQKRDENPAFNVSCSAI